MDFVDIPITQASYSGYLRTNSESYAASGKYYRTPESRPACLYEGTFDGSKVHVNHVRMEEIHGRSKRCALDATFSRLWKLTNRMVPSSGNCNVEALSTSKCCPLFGITAGPSEFISDWVPGGDLAGYLTKPPDANRHSRGWHSGMS